MKRISFLSAALLAAACGNDPAGVLPPTPSSLSATVLEDGAAYLSWSQCPDPDFESYTLWRSPAPGIPENPSQAVAVYSGMDVLSMVFTDTTATPGQHSYYCLETRNTSGLKAWSNEVAVFIPEQDPVLTIFFIDPTWGSLSGDAILVRTPGGRNYLIDGGSSVPQWNCGTDVIVPLLDSLGVGYLDGIVATHPHSDHIGGLIDILGTVPVSRVWDCGWPGEASSLYEQFLDEVDACGAQYIVARRGMTLDWGQELSVRVLHPTGSLGSGTMNNASIVLMLTFDGVRVLLAGDLETEGGEESVMAAFSPSELSACVLKVGHHGSDDATGLPWLGAVQPQYGFIEVGAGNPYGHPHPALLNRLSAAGTEVWRTDLNGTVRIETDGQTVTVFP